MQPAVKFFCGIFVSLACVTSAFAGDVIVNEIMYHPASTNVLEEWFELYNAGSTAVNLSGWQITKGVAFTFPTNTVLVAAISSWRRTGRPLPENIRAWPTSWPAGQALWGTAWS